MTMACVSTSLTDTSYVSEELPSVVPHMTIRSNPLQVPPTAKEASHPKPNKSAGIDSGYASAFCTSESDTLENGLAETSQKGVSRYLAGKFLQRKITSLRPFDKIVPEAAQDRFKDLHELFGVPLYKYVTKSGGITSAISIKLKILGESEDTAKPWIVVLCDRGVAKRVKHFFSQSWVKSEYQPCHTDPCRPSFEVYVYDRPPIMSATSLPSVYADWPGDASKRLTLCGSIIGVKTESNTSIATLGGVLSVTRMDGNKELYCMTVGHVIAGGQPENDVNELEEVGGEGDRKELEEDLEEEESYEGGADLISLEKQEYMLDLGFEGDRHTLAIGIVDQDPGTGDSIPSRLKIGSVAITSHDTLEASSNLDWALIKIDDPALYCPNLLLLPGKGEQGHILCEPMALSISKSQTTLPVYLLSGTRGVISGMLSFTLSALMLAPGKKFTDTYTLRLSNGLCKNSAMIESWMSY